jgi:hypothetical protein
MKFQKPVTILERHFAKEQSKKLKRQILLCNLFTY